MVLSDVDYVQLACIFLPVGDRARLYGEVPGYGASRDICGANPYNSPPLIEKLYHDGAERFRSEALQAIIRNAPKLPLSALVTWTVTSEKITPTAAGTFSRRCTSAPMTAAFLGRRPI